MPYKLFVRHATAGSSVTHALLDRPMSLFLPAIIGLPSKLSLNGQGGLPRFFSQASIAGAPAAKRLRPADHIRLICSFV